MVVLRVALGLIVGGALGYGLHLATKPMGGG